MSAELAVMVAKTRPTESESGMSLVKGEEREG